MEKNSANTKQGFWTVNRKLCMISMIVPTVVFWICLKWLICGIGSLLLLLLSLHIIYPIIITKILATNIIFQKDNDQELILIGVRRYLRSELQQIGGTIFAICILITILSGWLGILFKSNNVMLFLVFAMPYLIFHIFCLMRNHSPSIIRSIAFVQLQMAEYKGSNNNLFPNSSISSRPHEWSRSNMTGPYNIGGHTSIHGTYYSNNR